MEEKHRKQIEQIVKQYIKYFPDEYAFVVSKVGQRRKEVGTIRTIKDKEMGEFVGRELNRYPETLYNLFRMKLSPEAMVWLTTIEGARWFTKRFNEFALTEV